MAAKSRTRLHCKVNMAVTFDASNEILDEQRVLAAMFSSGPEQMNTHTSKIDEDMLRWQPLTAPEWFADRGSRSQYDLPVRRILIGMNNVLIDSN